MGVLEFVGLPKDDNIGELKIQINNKTNLILRDFNL